MNRRSMRCIMTAIAIAMASQASSRDLWGYMYYARTWPTASRQYGYMAFDAATASNFRDLLTEDQRTMAPNGGSSFYNGKYDFINFQRNTSNNTLVVTHYQLDTDRNWGLVYAPEEVDDVSLIATETATSQLSGKVYGQFYTHNLSGFEFGIIDYNKMERSTIAASQHKYVAMGVSSEERVYGVATDGYLYEIDTATGDERKIGSTGVYVAPSSKENYTQSGEIDQDDDTFYWASFDANKHGALYTVDLNTGKATLVADFPEDEEIYGLAIPEATPDANAPSAPGDLDLSFDAGATTGTLSFSVPVTAFGGGVLTGDLTYTVRSGSKLLATGTVAPGAIANVAITLPEGMNYVTVVLSNKYGKGRSASQSVFVGYDTPKPVTSPRLKIDESGNASVTWGASAGGLNGGYVGPVRYDIIRYPEGKTIASGYSGTAYTDKIEGSGLQVYYYGIVPVNGSKRGEERRTPAVRYGDNIEPPYTETFETEKSFGLFSTIDANHDSQTWEWDEDDLCAKYSTAKTAADDWLVTPPVHMLANHAYRVEFKAAKSLEYFVETIEAKWGNEPTVAGLSNGFLDKTSLPGTGYTAYGKEIHTSSDQLFYLGIHALSAAGTGRIKVDDVRITDEGCLDGPEASTDFIVTPDANAGLKAHVSFRLADKNVAGNNVGAITKVVVERDGTVVKEFGASKAGQTLSFDDNSPVAGNNTYTVTAYTAAGPGRPATRTAYIGLDTPAVPTGLSLSDLATGAQLSWKAVPATGCNGGAVLTEDVTYNVYRVRKQDGEQTYQLLGTTSEPTYLDPADLTSGSQEVRQYVVSAQNAKGESGKSAAESMLGGVPYTLPFKAGFADGDGAPLWWSLTGDADNGIGFMENAQTSSDGDNRSLVFTSYGQAATADIISGKIALGGVDNPEVIFSHAATTGKNAAIDVYVQGVGGKRELIGSVDYNDVGGKAEDWHDSSFKIPVAYAKEKYVVLTFVGKSDAYGVVRLDNVRVRNVYADDLAVDMSAPSEMQTGGKANVRVKVTNNGDNTASGYSVSLVADGEKVFGQTIGEPLAPLATRTFDVEVASSPNSTSSVLELSANVDYAADQNTSDNQRTVAVGLLNSRIPHPENLSAEQGDGTITLSWTAPAPASELVTEDFEQYDNWTVNTFGNWQTYTSNKGSVTGSLWGPVGMPFPHEGEKFTYIVFNPEAIQQGITSVNSTVRPLSGDKCLMSIWSRDGNTFLPTDDWLISPMLSGEEQTIDFWVNNGQSDPTNVRYPQTFQVLYSDRTTSPDDFKKVAEYTHSTGIWDEYSAELPYGALYFAIRCVTGSDDAYMFLVDDISFFSGFGTLKGFNVYCNGKLVKSLPADATTVTIDFDPNRSFKERYSLTAVFDGGESAGVTNDDCLVTAIRSVTVDAQHPVDVYTVDGKLVMKNATSLSALKCGVYVVNGQKIVK